MTTYSGSPNLFCCNKPFTAYIGKDSFVFVDKSIPTSLSGYALLEREFLFCNQKYVS